MPHLPMTRSEMAGYGWDELDFLFISGDAYVDHPSFGCAIITRVLEDAGYRVGVIAQPDVDDPESLLPMGRPGLAVLVSSGVVDSMVNHFTAAKKIRSSDAYTPGGLRGKRPDRALIRYGQMVRSQFGRIPLIIGGVEASLRRFAHYDYWSDSVRRSILQDSAADLLVFGEGDQTILDIARYLDRGISVDRLNALPGTALLLREDQLPRQTRAFLDSCASWRGDFSRSPAKQLSGRVLPEDSSHILLPSAEQVIADTRAYAIAGRYQEQMQDPDSGKVLIQPHEDRYLVQNPPHRPLTAEALDRIYALPYERSAHPQHAAAGPVPALEEVRFSITAHRGCYGGCHFCAITHHMGRIIRPRSDRSILAEVDLLAQMPGFKGIIHDVGGPTANFHQPACQKQRDGSVCQNRQCLFPRACPQLQIDHQPYLALLRQVRARPGVRKVFIRSGIRYDTLMADGDPAFFTELCQHHVSGQLKVAPEHVSAAVLDAMGKPGAAVYQDFCKRYQTVNEQLGLRQYLVPYLMSGHPGSTLQDAIELALFLRRERRVPEQVQDFYPTPGTLSTVMYHSRLNPLTMEPIHVPDEQEKKWQRALLQPTLPHNRQSVVQALQAAGRMDLAGYGPDKLLAPLPDKLTKRSRSATTPETKGGTHHEHNHPRKRTGRQPAHTDGRRRGKAEPESRKTARTGRHSGR
jgi:uncharacterized radical SAM protein YgiQ